jgi:hypothetical protein
VVRGGYDQPTCNSSPRSPSCVSTDWEVYKYKQLYLIDVSYVPFRFVSDERAGKRCVHVLYYVLRMALTDK